MINLQDNPRTVVAGADAADTLMAQLSAAARAAQAALARLPSATRAEALRAAAGALRSSGSTILAANAEDLARAQAAGLAPAMLDRLKLDTARLEGIAAGVEQVAALPDPVGAVIDRSERPNGLVLERVRVPIGVIGIIYESRPNVTIDAAALAVRVGNAAILRGGSEAVASNRALHRVFADALAAAGLPAAAVQLVPDQDRALVGAMLRASDGLDLVVPRGGKSLVARVQAEARVPVLAHLDGLCTTYVHAAADPAMARDLVVNAKMRRTGICGATETVLVDRGFDPAGARAIVAALLDAGCEVRGDAFAQGCDPRVAAAGGEDWDTEFLAPVVALRLVDGLDEAIAHIGAHGSHHTDAIVTGDENAAARFLDEVDSAIVMHNASTQFADGGEFGLGAEIGIATGRLHARGPVALEGLTTYKWRVRGTGQSRP